MSDPVPPVPLPDPATPQPPSAQPWWILPLMGAVGEAIFFAGLVLAYRLENPTLFNVALGAAIGQAQKDETSAAIAVKQNDTIAATSAALAVSAPVNGTKPPGT